MGIRVHVAQEVPAQHGRMHRTRGQGGIKAGLGSQGAGRAGTGLDPGLRPNDKLLLSTYCMQGSLVPTL